MVASKQHGARAIQLPNKTHKIVAGIIDGNELVNLFGAPEVLNNNSKITIAPSSSANAHFLSVVPSQNMRVASSQGAKIEEGAPEILETRTVTRDVKGYEEHFQYVLQSKKGEKPQDK